MMICALRFVSAFSANLKSRSCFDVAGAKANVFSVDKQSESNGCNVWKFNFNPSKIRIGNTFSFFDKKKKML